MIHVPSKAVKLPHLESKARAYAFKISNKYYDATVRLLAKSLPVDDDATLEALAQDLKEAHCQAIGGGSRVILILPRLRVCPDSAH